MTKASIVNLGLLPRTRQRFCATASGQTDQAAAWPDDFHPVNPAQLSQGLFDLWPKVFPYLLSFGVLGLRWLSAVRARSEIEFFCGSYVAWWMLSMLLTTCVPFTTIVVGRYASLASAVWLYAGNVALLAIAAWCQLRSLTEEREASLLQGRQIATSLLLASAAACIVYSLFDPKHALWAFMLNLAGPALVRRSAAS